MTLITSRDLDKIKQLNELFKSHSENVALYDKIIILFEKIHHDSGICDNLRGTFLELVTHDFLKRKYDTPENSFKSALDCYVEILGTKSKRTVDVFALCEGKGFVCECKISHKYLEGHDLANLNQIYNDSHKILSPFIITLSPQKFIEKKLTNIALEDDANILVHWNEINILSLDNLSKFFS